MDNITIWHLRDLAGGVRRRVLAKDVKHIAVPQFEGLGIREMLDYAEMFPQVMKALPLRRQETEKLPR